MILQFCYQPILALYPAGFALAPPAQQWRNCCKVKKHLQSEAAGFMCFGPVTWEVKHCYYPIYLGVFPLLVSAPRPLWAQSFCRCDLVDRHVQILEQHHSMGNLQGLAAPFSQACQSISLMLANASALRKQNLVQLGCPDDWELSSSLRAVQAGVCGFALCRGTYIHPLTSPLRESKSNLPGCLYRHLAEKCCESLCKASRDLLLYLFFI